MVHQKRYVPSAKDVPIFVLCLPHLKAERPLVGNFACLQGILCRLARPVRPLVLGFELLYKKVSVFKG